MLYQQRQEIIRSETAKYHWTKEMVSAYFKSHLNKFLTQPRFSVFERFQNEQTILTSLLANICGAGIENVEVVNVLTRLSNGQCKL